MAKRTVRRQRTYECHIAQCDERETAYSKLNRIVEKHIRQTKAIDIYKVSGKHMTTFNYPKVESYTI